jgi:hypothetical protein
MLRERAPGGRAHVRARVVSRLLEAWISRGGIGDRNALTRGVTLVEIACDDPSLRHVESVRRAVTALNLAAYRVAADEPE